jgi:hypothetical protein
MERWSDLCVAQFAICGDFATVKDLGIPAADDTLAAPAMSTHGDLLRATVLECVSTVGKGLLEVVQSIGDTFLVAGPLGSDEEEVVHEAVKRAVALVGTLAAKLPGRAKLNAALVCDSAFGALLGSKMLSFRLFGVAVQRSDAILAAIPASSQHLAVATATFRRCHDAGRIAVRGNGTGRVGAVAAMSMALPPMRDAGDGSDVFGTEMRWRVRGAGLTSLFAIALPQHTGPR